MQKKITFTKKLQLLLFVTIIIKPSFCVHYNGYKVFEIIPRTEEQQKVLELLHASDRFDFWSTCKLVNYSNIVMVAPDLLDNFQVVLNDNNLDYAEMIENVGSFEDQETLSRVDKEAQNYFHLNQYNTYNDMNEYLKELEINYSSFVNLFKVSRTIEGRDIYGVKVSKKTSSHNKSAILIDAGIHAREWITSATAFYIIHQLVNNTDNHEMLTNLDWYIIPLMNPDGYVYSRKSDRFWRKNRSKGKYCSGVDLNRNFNFHWMQGGSSADECSEIYAGRGAFSEPETVGLKDFFLEHKNQIKLYLSLHSFGNFILYPWSYTTTPPDDSDELQAIGEIMRDAIEKVNGRKYDVGECNEILYQASGDSEDWVKGVAGIPFAYTIELPGGGKEGFDIPASQIENVAEEAFEAIRAAHDYIIQKST